MKFSKYAAPPTETYYYPDDTTIPEIIVESKEITTTEEPEWPETYGVTGTPQNPGKESYTTKLSTRYVLITNESFQMSYCV